MSIAGRALPARLKPHVRRFVTALARVRSSRAWPIIRPAYRVVRRFVDLRRLVDVGAPEDVARAQRRVAVTRRRLTSLGFTAPAIRELQDLATTAANPALRRLAAWELVLWHSRYPGRAPAYEALRWLPIAAEGTTDQAQLQRIAILEAECLAAARLSEEAKQSLARIGSKPVDPDVLLAHANLASTVEKRVALINHAFRASGLSTVSVAATPAQRPALDRLVPHGRPPRKPHSDDPLVSVILPVRDGEATIDTALRSILAQTWSHLEVLVVDDASRDGTVEVVTRFARHDARVRLLQSATASGPYVARNLGLSEATGEFVTCHDADDWSHPEKIERQVTHLRSADGVVGNTSRQARAAGDLKFHRRGQPGHYIFRNLSSFMFRREPVLESVGFWDNVKFGGDEEFVQRIIAVFGRGAVVDLASGLLSIQRQAAGTLTTHAHFGYPGFLMGVRHDYQQSYRLHHRSGQDLRYPARQQCRPFSVPAPMLPRRPAGDDRHFDVIVASDFRLHGGSTASSVEEIKAQTQAGLRTGLVQLSRYDVDPFRDVLPAVRYLIDGDRVQMICHGEQVTCDLLIIRYPPVLQYPQRYVPTITAGDIRVVVNQPPMSDYGPDRVLRYEIPRCAAQIRRYFGKDATWHPIGPLVRSALNEHHAAELDAIDLSDEDWVNIVEVGSWARHASPAREGRPIRIGRHSRDHPHKWPATASDLLSAYPEDPRYEVYVLGGSRAPEQVVGYVPHNWRVWGFGTRPVREFLAELDVFVYFTHPHWVESFGRVIIEAMASGVPVVLPHVYCDLFEDAAVYAKPSEVVGVVDALVADEAAYQQAVLKGQQYVADRFGYSHHIDRIRRLCPVVSGEPGGAEAHPA